MTLRRIDAITLDVEAPRGWGYAPSERIFCAASAFPQLGRERVLNGLKVRVLAANLDGRPMRTRFQFGSPLEARDRLWLAWDGERLRTFLPPALGRSAQVAGHSLLWHSWR